MMHGHSMAAEEFWVSLSDAALMLQPTGLKRPSASEASRTSSAASDDAAVTPPSAPAPAAVAPSTTLQAAQEVEQPRSPRPHRKGEGLLTGREAGRLVSPLSSPRGSPAGLRKTHARAPPSAPAACDDEHRHLTEVILGPRALALALPDAAPAKLNELSNLLVAAVSAEQVAPLPRARPSAAPRAVTTSTRDRTLDMRTHRARP
jgi:hypothetical protein